MEKLHRINIKANAPQNKYDDGIIKGFVPPQIGRNEAFFLCIMLYKRLYDGKASQSLNSQILL